jgi:hypothetical protein
MSQPESGLPRLGSLAQSARSKQLNTARGLLIFIGVATILFNVIQLMIVKDQIKKGIDQEISARLLPGQQVNEVERQKIENAAIVFAYILCGSLIFLGLLFVVFGLIVKLFPVPVTVISLVLYLGAIAVFAVLNPPSLGAGIIIKIFIVIALVKAIQSAIAYQKAERSAAMQVSLAEE